MALTGNYTKYTYTEDASSIGLTSHSVAYPSDLTESDPNYSKRGTIEWVSGSVWTKASESIDNIYLRIHNYTYFTIGSIPSDPDDDDSALIKNNIMQVTYRIYNSKAEAIEDYNSHIHADDHTFSLVNDELTTSLSDPSHEYAYTRLKTTEGFENLTNA
tara:strand:+ start:81 stop:557 length:477 start_codon:yes stop_codon:yes gene_type:complete